MPLSFKPFAQVDSDDIRGLQHSGVPEGARIDYKREQYAPNESREFLKDISAFANAQGGYLLIGASESNGVIDDLPGIPSETIDTELQRLESWARDGIEPRIFGIQMRRVDLSDRRSAVIIFVPKSMNPPHRVSSQNKNRFYVRNSSGSHEASVEELRQLFGFSARLSQDIREFIAARRQRIMAGSDTVKDEQPARLIVHIVNASTFGDMSFVNVKELYDRPWGFGCSLRSPNTHRMTLEGILFGAEHQGLFWDRTLIFRNGCIESVHSRLSGKSSDGEQLTIGAPELLSHLLAAVHKAMSGLSQLGATGPFVVAAALQVPENSGLDFDGWGHSSNFDRTVLELPELTFPETSISIDAAAKMLRPMLDNLWNSVGIPECRYFEDGEWQSPVGFRT